jgi:tRNA nucleotidyltransferase/poly(A) polymerase
MKKEGEIMRQKLSYNEIWDALENEGFQTFLVGGAVRDIVMGLEPEDFDLCTSARPGQIGVCISRLYPEAKINYVGVNFGVVIVDDIEVATFRSDVYSNTKNNGDHKDVQVVFGKSIEDDLKRRDLTINAMALSRSGELIDPFGGVQDIKDKLIRFVGDPAQRIKEDANRIIRLCRFVARFDFEVNAETVEAIGENLHLVRSVAPERIRIEILKAMKIQNASSFFGALFFTGALEIIFPELAACWFHVGGKHHPESVWDHIMLVGDAISTKFPLVKLSGFLHDVGKPEAWFRTKGDGFDNHHSIGADIVKERLENLRFTNSEVKFVTNLVQNHMRMVFDSTKKSSRKTLQKLSEGDCSWRDLIRVRIADNKANLSKHPHSITEIKNLIRSLNVKEEVPFTVKELAVSGAELIKEFNLVPSRIVSETQKFLLEEVLSGCDNERSVLLDKAKSFL